MRNALIVGIARDITREQGNALKEQMEERLGLPVFVISGCTALTIVEMEPQ